MSPAGFGRPLFEQPLFFGPIEPSEFLRLWLDEFAPVALGVNSEKARSEFIIAPVLAEICASVACAGISANPLADLDAKWGKGFLKGPKFAEMVADNLVKNR